MVKLVKLKYVLATTVITKPCPFERLQVGTDDTLHAGDEEHVQSVQKKQLTVLAGMPTKEHVASATSGWWAELPWNWKHEGSISELPKFDQELYNLRAAAAAGLSPAFRGSAIILSDSASSLYSRIKFVEGVLLNSAWLRDATCKALHGLHDTTPHKHCPVGVLVMDRPEYTLKNLPADVAQQLEPRSEELQRMLNDLHAGCIRHGLLNMGINPSCVGITLQPHVRLTLIDWSNAINQICLEKLPDLNKNKAWLDYLFKMTDGVVKNALQVKKLPPHDKPFLSSGLLGWLR